MKSTLRTHAIRVVPFGRCKLLGATIAWLLASTAVPLHSQINTRITTVHIATNGNDSASGAASQPLATFAKALALIDGAGGPGEVIIHGGTYVVPFAIPESKRSDGKPVPPLLVRAADGEKAVFDGSITLHEAKPLEGHAGVYVAEGNFGLRPPLIWEQESRVRYMAVADLAAVQAFPASLTLLDARHVAFHTTDGESPKTRNVRMSDRLVGFGLYRDNTTLRGFHFENFVTSRWAAGAQIYAGTNVTIDSCTFFNCFRGIIVGAAAESARVLNCRMSDVGGGVYINGIDATVEHCWLTKQRDSFMIHTGLPQDDTAIQYYSPAAGGTCRFNFGSGFVNGIYMKASPGRRYVVEHNTLIAGPDNAGTALYNNHWLATSNSVYRANILVGYSTPLVDPLTINPNGIFDENVCWSPKFEDETTKVLAAAIDRGTGRRNVMANPIFVAPEMEDYRLAAGSKAIELADRDGPAGAFPAAPKGLKVKLPPTVTIEPQAVKLAGPSGKLFVLRDDRMDRDFQFVQDLRREGPPKTYITASRDVKLSLQARDPAFAVKKLGVQVDEGKENIVRFAPEIAVQLPDADGVYQIKVRVQNSEGTWSIPAAIPVVLARKAPQLVGTPKVLSNASGVVILFRTDRPAIAQVELSPSTGEWLSTTNQPQSQVKYDAGSGTANRQEWVVPAEVHTRSLIAPMVKPNAEYRYRLALSDELGNKVVTEPWSFKTTETAPRTLCVATDGRDEEGRGGPDQPLRTLQFAVDRALPGDTVRLAPGIYPDPAVLSHGGVKDKPITIEAAEPNTVFCDGRKEQATMVRLAHAPYIVIRNLNFRWFKEVGISVEDSEHVTISHCRFINHFWAEWADGHGIDVYAGRRVTIDHCTFARLGYGMYMRNATHAQILNNTCIANTFGSMWAMNSSKGTVIRNNAFCFNGDRSWRIFEADTEAFKSLDLDYNNYAAQIRDGEEERPDMELKVPVPYLTPSKQMIDYHTADKKWNENYRDVYYCSLKRWRSASGKDAHSIFADPKFVAPAEGRFDVQKDSPNLGAGKDGADIGASGYLGEKMALPAMKD